MRRSILACGLLLAFAGLTTAAAAAVGSGKGPTATAASTTGTSTTGTTRTSTTTARAVRRALAYWNRHIRRYRAGTRRWLTVIRGRPPRRVTRRTLSGRRSVQQLRRLARRWHRREHRVWRRANHPPHFGGWLCIHRYEGSWTDSGAPYWGGLQMDFSFQATYGGWLLRHKGTADHWSPLEQIWAAERAARVRGFSPWPSTARSCGLA